MPKNKTGGFKTKSSRTLILTKIYTIKKIKTNYLEIIKHIEINSRLRKINSTNSEMKKNDTFFFDKRTTIHKNINN